MINQQLTDFIKQQLQVGLTKEKISSELLANGWNGGDIEEGFKAIGDTPPSILTSTSIPIIPSTNNNISSITQVKSHSGKKLFFIVFIILVLLAGGASAYYFKDELVKLPVIKDFFPQEEAVIEDVIVPDTTQPDVFNQTDKVVTPEQNATLSVYNDPNGLYSFSYSKDEKIIDSTNSSVSMSIYQDNNPVVVITVVTDINNVKLNSFLNMAQFTKSSFDTISTYPSDKYVAIIKGDNKISNTVYESIYIINLGSYNNTKLSILFNALVNINDQKITDQIEKNVKSFMINKNNIASVIKASIAELKDTPIKQALQKIRSIPEIYYNKSNSYVGFCASSEYTNAVKDIIKLTTLNCKDSADAYAITASISSGYWCIDNTGYNDSSSLNTGTACVK